MTTSKFQLQLRIDWSELDLYGHVNNVAFFKYTQAARLNSWISLGLEAGKDSDGLGPILASASCQFRKPLFFPGEVLIESELYFLKTTSFGMKHSIFNPKNELVATADDVVVMYDFQKKMKADIPIQLRVALKKYLLPEVKE